MTEEDFLTRWSRRKRAAAEEPAKAQPVAQDKPGETAAAPRENDNAGAPAPAEAKAEEAFDLASLPPVESVGSASDVAIFLRKGVPAELTRAALRRAWVADPAIRDFVGLAENAWDFNDPTAIPGFGPLDQTPEQVRALVSQLFTKTEQAIEEITQPPRETTPPAEPVNETKEVASALPDNSGKVPLPESETALPAEQGEPVERVATISAAQHEEREDAHTARRSHGSALPR
ncbi:MAG: DUF3306 domain-containing protein [Pseudolabrys sp.]